MPYTTDQPDTAGVLHGRQLYMFRVEHGGKSPGESRAQDAMFRHSFATSAPEGQPGTGPLRPDEVGGVHESLRGRELYMARILNRGRANVPTGSVRPDPTPPPGLSGRDLWLWRGEKSPLAGSSWSNGIGENT